MKVDTIKHFQIMQFIKSRFEMDKISINFWSDTEILLTDKKDDSIIFFIEDGIVKWRDA